MLPKYLNIITRIAGLIITVLLLIQPWFVVYDAYEPLITSGWSLIYATSISLLITAGVLAFYRPKGPYIGQASGIIALIVAIGASLAFSNYIITFRASMLALGLVVCLGALRLFRKDQDNLSVAGMIAISGLFMALYAFSTERSTDFLSLFLCLTASITLGFLGEIQNKTKTINAIILFTIALLQIFAVIYVRGPLSLISLTFIVYAWFWAKNLKVNGKMSRRSPIVVGLVLAIAVLICQHLFYVAISSYQWDKITQISPSEKRVVSEFVIWEMGYNIFKRHPLVGCGVGALSYVLPLEPSPLNSSLSINLVPKDTQSIVISALAECGILGLVALCIFITSIFGSFIRKNSRYQAFSEKEIDNSIEEDNSLDFPWISSLIFALILFLSSKAGFFKFIDYKVLASLVSLYFGVVFGEMNKEYKFDHNNSFFSLSRSTLIAICVFLAFSLFNSSFSFLSLTCIMVVICSLHFSACQPNVQWKPRITFVSLLLLVVPFFYYFVATQFQKNYEEEHKSLLAAVRALDKNKFEEAEDGFNRAIALNPQGLKAYHGLALALEANHKIEDAIDVLVRLDNMVPNVFNAKYEIARILFETDKLLDAHRYAIKNLEWSKDPLAYEILAQILLREGRLSKAEEVFKEGLSAPQSNHREELASDRIKLSLAAIESQKGNFKTSDKYLEGITTEVNRSLDAMYLNGMLLTRRKKFDDALKHFEEAYRLYPQVPRIQNALGFVLIQLNKDLDRAENLIKMAYDGIKEEKQTNLSDFLMIANSLGKVYLKRNKLTEAGLLLQLSYENTPDEWKTLKRDRLRDLNDFYNSFAPAE